MASPGEQFSNDSGSGARSNYNLRGSGLKRFHGGFQLRPHAAAGDSRVDKLPALIRI